MSQSLNNIALALGKKKFSPQTKFLHYFPQKDAEDHHTIPLFENFAFALSLFRSKEIDNIELALDLLERSLRFQTDSGAFPRFIHEYPLDHLYPNGVDILNILYWIAKEFKKVMSVTLKEKLDDALASLINFCDSKRSFFSKSLIFRFELLQNAIQGNPSDLSDTYFSEQFFEESFSQFFSSKEGLKDLFLSLQIYDLENKHELTKKIWGSSLKFYHKNLFSYVGPSDNIFQNQYKEELHLIDLFFLSLLKLEKTLNLDDPICLQASLIRPLVNLDLLNQEDREFFSLEKEGKKWVCLKEKNYSFVSLENTSPIDKMFFGFHLFKLTFGNHSFVNNLVCQHFEGKFTSKLNEKHEMELEFIFPAEIKEDEFELKFFVENQGCQIFVNDLKATSFDFNDTITIKNGGAKVLLSFELLDNQSKFCGHILRANRPSQLSSRKDKFVAFDYLISFRTVSRPALCNIKAKLQVYPC